MTCWNSSQVSYALKCWRFGCKLLGSWMILETNFCSKSFSWIYPLIIITYSIGLNVQIISRIVTIVSLMWLISNGIQWFTTAKVEFSDSSSGSRLETDRYLPARKQRTSVNVWMRLRVVVSASRVYCRAIKLNSCRVDRAHGIHLPPHLFPLSYFFRTCCPQALTKLLSGLRGPWSRRRLRRSSLLHHRGGYCSARG